MSERIVTRHITPHTWWQGPESEAPASPDREASAPKVYHIGDRTMEIVFAPAGLKNLSDLQAMFDRLEVVLTSAADTQAVADVIAERHRQVEAEGWTPEHDDDHAFGKMACAAACYALNASPHFAASRAGSPSRFWPWNNEWWKPTTPRRDLVKAAALILAEIDRLDRAAAKVDS